MKIYIVCDLEGVAGVVDFKKQCMEDGAYYKQAIKMATKELNSLIDGAINGGATEIFAWPGHGAFPGDDLSLIGRSGGANSRRYGCRGPRRIAVRGVRELCRI